MEDNIPARILVVDDNPAGLYATSRILRASGFAVIEATTGLDALALATGADLVVLDVNLPDISGFEVCRRIRSTHEISRIPVVHLSATFVKDADKVQGLEAGADGYLTHPVEPPVLIATVNAFLRARRAEDEMRRSEAKFKAIFDQALLGILLLSKELVCLEVNPALCVMLGRKREEIVGRNASSFIPAAYQPQLATVAQEVETIGVWRGAFPLIRSDGTHLQLEWNIARHSVPGVRLAIVNDITDRKTHEVERERLHAAERLAREDAERANRLKDDFLANLSHELRTPLTAIVGWSKILKDGNPTTAEISQGIDAIERNARSQSQLISDLLEVSRITSGKLRLDIRTIDVAALINASLETIVPAAQAKGIQIKRELTPTAGNIQADPDRIQQVIWNLVMNAVKFTPKGGLISVTLTREYSKTVITVSDNGQGISPDFLSHIFERFRQENATTRRNQGGLGLGLAIVKHLVEMHGGTVTAHSEGENKGATFIVRLPISPILADNSQATQDNNSNPPPQPPSTSVDLANIRVLVVEDDVDARALLRRVLTSAGAQVQEAADVPTALLLLKQSEPQVLISDVGMPNQDGYDLIRSVRATTSSTDLPAIALTAFATHEDRQKSLTAGFQLHLPKPVDGDELLSAVATLATRAKST